MIHQFPVYIAFVVLVQLFKTRVVKEINDNKNYAMGMAVFTSLLYRPKLFLLIERPSMITSKRKNTEYVPEDTNDTCIYIVPIQNVSLNHFKRKRPWDMLNRVKSKV